MSGDEQISRDSNIGKVITFGSLHLFLTLKLEKEDLENINYYDLKGLEDLEFLTSNEKLWEKIQLTTKNDLIDTLFKMNRIKEKKNIVAYIVLDKISFNEEQSKFQKLLDSVLLDNGLVIYSYEVCKCKLSINLKLIYKNNIKQFVIYGDGDYDEDEDEKEKEKENAENEEENKEKKSENEKKRENESFHSKSEKEENNEKEEDEEDTNDIGLFKNIPEEVKFNNFKFIYIHFKDFTSGGEFANEFKKNQLYNFLKQLKSSCEIKIIFNFCDLFEKNEEYLIKFIQISDIHIFKDKYELLDILRKKFIKEEIKREKQKEKIKNFFKSQKIQNSSKLGSKNSSTSNLKQTEVLHTPREYFNYSLSSTFTKKAMYRSQSYANIRKTTIYPTIEKNIKTPLDKNNLYYYLNELIFILNNNNEKHTNNDKLGIYLDEFKKINLVKYKKLVIIPNIIEYDLNIYPKSNVFNLKEIDKIKQILMKDNNLYTNILYGCILSTIINDTDNYYMYYFYSRISILKLLALKKNNMPIPKDKSFYLVKIDKKEFNKILKEENTKKLENGFNNNHFQLKYKGNDCKYYPLMDKFLTSYMQSLVNINTLKNKNLINENKKILYDPEYKDLFKFGSYFNEDIDNQKFVNFVMTKNVYKNIHIKEKDYKKEFLNKKPEMKYHLPGINGIPEYIVYLNKEERLKILKNLKNKLPPINMHKKKPKKENEKKEVVKMIKNNGAENTEKKQAQNKEAQNNLNNVQEADIDKDKDKDKEKENEKDEINNKYKEIKFEPTQLEENNL